jgi:hypothetical protein
MPIIQLQRRLREIGRIRIGETKVSAGGKKYPAKLGTFRLTSQDGSVISAAAETFGGEPKPWKDAPAGEQFEVVTTTSSLNVIVPPTGMAFSQFYEAWSGGGCQKRCDGQWDVLRDQACDCDPGNRECKPHTRLSVILSDLPALGVWRLDTQGYYAAVELGGVVEVIEGYARRGQMLPARLRLEQREVKRPGEPAKKFVVPVLDVEVNLGRLMLGQSEAPATAGELPAGEGSFTAVNQAALPAAPERPVAAQIAEVSAEAPAKKPRRNAAAPMQPTGLAPRTAAQAAAADTPERLIGSMPSVRSQTPPAEPTSSGQRLHIQAGEVVKALEGEFKADLLVDAVVLAVTELRTDSTKDLEQREANKVALKLNDVSQGRVEIVEHFTEGGEARYGLVFDDAELTWTDAGPRLERREAVAS